MKQWIFVIFLFFFFFSLFTALKINIQMTPHSTVHILNVLSQRLFLALFAVFFCQKSQVRTKF